MKDEVVCCSFDLRALTTTLFVLCVFLSSFLFSGGKLLVDSQYQRQLFLFSILKSLTVAKTDMVKQLKVGQTKRKLFVESMDSRDLLQRFIRETLKNRL